MVTPKTTLSMYVSKHPNILGLAK